MPLDLEFFENVIVFNVLQNETYLCSVIEHLRPEYFDNKDIAAVIGLVSSFYNDRSAVPTVTEIKTRIVTKEQRQSFVNVATSFKSMDTEFNNAELLENTEHFLRQKAVYNAILIAADNISSQAISPAETLDQFEQACNISLTHDFGVDIVSEIDKFIDIIDQDTSFIPTGYHWLDTMLGGGWLETGKVLYIFCAATNVGKSIMLSNLASNLVSQNKTAVMFTLEMSEEMYGKRIASNLTSIPINSLRENKDILKDDIDTIREENSKAHLIVKEFPTKGATVRHLEAYIKTLYEKRKILPDVIFVDYLNLLVPAIATGNTYIDVKSIAEDLRSLSYKFGGIPIVSATQLNRCLDVDTLVQHSDGTFGRIGNIATGDTICGENGDVEVKHVYPRETQKCYKITTKTGKEIICSSKHLFPISDGRIVSIDSGLQVGDKFFVKD